MQEISNKNMLIDAIGAGNSDPSARGPVVVSLNLWDGRRIEGAYYRGSEMPDVTAREDVIWDTGALRPFVEKLLAEDASFITETGSHDMVCTLQWTILDKAA